MSITLRLTWVWDQEKASTQACPIGTKDLEWVVETLSNRTTRHHITKVQDHQSLVSQVASVCIQQWADKTSRQK